MSVLHIQNAAYPQGDTLCIGDILIDNGVIVSIGEGARVNDAPAVDAAGDLILPGFLDLHMHGAVGVDANAADAEGLVRISRFLSAHGVTGFLVSILTDTEAQTLRAIRAACEASRYADGAELLGIHLEGPFLSEVYAGAMPKHLLSAGDIGFVRRCQSAAAGMVKTITVSPEVCGVIDIIPALADEGIAVMLGHSNATCAEGLAAVEAGAVGITHTFNAMRLFHQHEPGLMGAALLSDVYCEAICDGLHLHPDAVRLLYKLKGSERILAVSDSIMATGLPDGEYRLGVNEIVVKNGDAMLKERPVRAGSTLTLDRAYRNIRSFTGASVAEAARMTSGNAAALLGRHDLGRIAVGARANLIRLDRNGAVVDTWIGGHPAVGNYKIGKQ